MPLAWPRASRRLAWKIWLAGGTGLEGLTREATAQARESSVSDHPEHFITRPFPLSIWPATSLEGLETGLATGLVARLISSREGA